MGTVLLSCVDFAVTRYLSRGSSRLVNERIEVLQEFEQVLERLNDADEDADLRVDVVGIGTDLRDSVLLAQRAHAADRDMTVLMLAEESELEQLATVVRFAPFLGPEVSCCAVDPLDALERRLAAGAVRTRQRRGYRATIQSSAAGLSAGLPAPIQPHAVVEQFMAQLPIGVLAVCLDGRVRSLNRRAAELLGLTERDLVGQYLGPRLPEAAAANLERLLAVIRSGQEPSWSEAFEVENGHGACVLELSAVTVAGSPTVVSALVLLQDVSERSRAEREQQRLNEELSQARRLAALGMLAAGVGHEINNPLTYVMCNLHLLRSRLSANGNLPAEARAAMADLASVALEGADRIRRIVGDLGEFVRGDQRKVEAVDVTQLMDRALAMAANQLRHCATVYREYGAVPLAWCNGPRLEQVFLNLLTNAGQAIGDGAAGRHSIRVEIAPSGSDEIAVVVRDSGVGMSPEVVRRVFEPFFTTKPVGHGTGLGLSLCQRIIVEQGGTISLESEVGVGTAVSLTLPVAGGRESPGERPSLPAPQAEPVGDIRVGASRREVLVIDDERAVAAAIQRTLEGSHDVTVECLAEAALARIRAGERYAVILCDLMMPEMNGISFHTGVARLDQAQARRIVFMSGGVFSTSLAESLEQLPNERLMKPFDSNALISLVEQLGK